MSLLIKAGRLVSTTDIKLARKLHQVVRVHDITDGHAPQALKQAGDYISFIYRGEFYELERI